ncbi:NAD(P)-dependent oxidoreductase [Aquabacterium sp.]|uniref:NAD(P)-dependent oxidoreductase n=1 Tax=Aquabacterium sp. TaxID=1872578 RepID=UPI003D6C7A38
MRRIAVLGMGAMGSRMARRLLAAGHAVTIFNRGVEAAKELVQAGALSAATPAMAAADADVVISMVTDARASKAVWLDPVDGALHALRKGSVAIESSTLFPSWVRELGQMVHAKGAQFLDAPVVGSRPQAQAGELIFLVGGSQGCLTHVRPILEVLGSRISHVGEVGDATVMKLAANALFGMQVVTLAEILSFIEAEGLDSCTAIGALTDLPVISPVAKNIMAQMLSRNYLPMFPVELALKDFKYLQAAASEAGAPALPVLQAGTDVFDHAVQKGHGQENISAVAQLYKLPLSVEAS